MKRLALALVMLSLALGSCTPSLHTATAPRPWLKYYHHEQRKNERQRRRLVKTNVTWSKL
jgi:hypothetical protein